MRFCRLSYADKDRDCRLPSAGRPSLSDTPFSIEGDAAARRLGLEPQQYSLLLAVRGLPDGSETTIQALAERLILKHNSTVELIDRLETRGYLYRSRSLDDRRYALVKLLPRGNKLLERVARQRLPELRAGGAALVNALDAVLGRKPKSRRANKSAQCEQMKRRGRKS